MKIFKENKGRRKLIWKDVELADSLLKQMKGIMFRKRLKRPVLFIFGGEQSISIHSFFCIPFDIIYINNFGKIIEINENVNSDCVLPKTTCKYIIECNLGEVKRKKLKKGDLLSF